MAGNTIYLTYECPECGLKVHKLFKTMDEYKVPLKNLVIMFPSYYLLECCECGRQREVINYIVDSETDLVASINFKKE